MQKTVAVAATVLLFAAALAAAQQRQPQSTLAAPATSPATRPTTRPIAPPPGFVRLSFAPGVEALCEPGDEAWVREALGHVEPATRPTTMPVDLVARLGANRGQLVAQMAADTLAERAAIDSFLDQKLIPALKDLQVNRGNLVYLVTTIDKTKALLRSGWENPQLHYNRLSDQFTYERRLDLGPNGAGAEPTLIMGLYPPAMPVEQRTLQLRQLARGVDKATLDYLSSRGIEIVLIAFSQFVREDATAPLGLKPDEQWFDLGVMGALSAKYAAILTDIPRARLLAALTRTPPNFPVNADRLDLLHLTPLQDLRREYVGPYLDAVRRRATAAVDALTAGAGDEAIPKMIRAIRKSPPGDAVALVKLIAETTGVDLTPQLGAR